MKGGGEALGTPRRGRPLDPQAVRQEVDLDHLHDGSAQADGPPTLRLEGSQVMSALPEGGPGDPSQQRDLRHCDGPRPLYWFDVEDRLRGPFSEHLLASN